MSKIPAINEIDANSPSQESTEVVVKATTVTPDINEIQETISASATIQEIDGTRKPTISEIYKIVNDGLFESTTNWWDYAYKLSQAQLNQDIISRLDNGVIGGGYSKGVDIITTTSNKVPSNTNVYSALKSDSLYPKKLNDEVINGIYDFLNGLTIGKPTAYTGGTWSVDQTGRTHLTTDYLYVRLKAIFETLQILNVDTIGGKLVISPAGSIKVAYVDRIRIDAPVFKHDENTDVWSISQVEDAEGNLVNETLNQEVYRCYFLGEQDGEEIDNKWKVGDQAQAKTFNVKKGTYHKVENSYLWRLVVNVSSGTVDIDGKKYHYVDLSQIDFDSGSDAPAPGDVLNQLGHRLNDTQRQTSLVLNAVDNYAPSITLYAGVNYYTLLNKEYVEFGVYNGKAFFNVYGDMYIGDKGENPKTYIKYKNGKINIKANLEIGSSIGDKDLDQYIKENGGVDEETVNNLINNSQVIKDLQKQTDGAIETWFYEGVPTLDNLPAVDWNTSELKKIHIGDLYYDQTTGYAYRFTKYNDDVNPYRWNRIKDNDIVSALDAANRAQITADGKMKVFYGETKPTNYQVGDMWVNATLEGKFNNDIARAVADNKTSFNANDWVLASRYSEAIATIQKWTNEYETKFSNLVDEVKQQKDQSIVVWYYDYEPTVDNAPANTWNTDELRSEHIGDIFYDIKNNHSYRWTGTTWIQIKDADFNEAMKAAKAADDKAGAAGDLADSKRRIFYSDTTPTEPFDKGDLWIKRVGDKTETWVYNGIDWVKSDDKALNDFKNAINEELAGIKGQLDGKAETWYQLDDPSTDWTDKASHEGDIWYNTSNGTTNYWNGSAWEQMDIPKDVFDTIDGKSSIFVDSYVDAKAGTGVISKGYKERDLWILPEDATVNGVKYYKGDMLTAVSKNTNFDETNWKKKVRYVGPTELNKAIDVVNEKINTINNITIPGINNKFNEFIEDGVLDSSEKARLTDLLNQASNEVAAVIDQVNNIITSKYLTNDNANKGKLEEANNIMKTAWTEYKKLINTLIAANTEITKVNIGEANTKYRNLQEKIKTVKQYLAICQADILSGMGTDITSYKYLKDALNQTTEINGGLVLTSAIQLKDVDKKVTAGMNGIVKGDKTSIAAWYGGPMVDRDTFTSEELETKVPGTDYAMSLLRHDGTGYLAGGNIHWNANGVLSGNFNSFILQGTSMVTMFYYIRLFYLHTANPDSTDFNNIDYVTPMKTFSRLSVLPLGGVEGGNNLPTGLFIGDSNTGGSFQIGNIILRTKSGDPNILEIVSASSNKTAHLGVQGGVSAYGTYTPSTGGGGGLNGTIIPYSTAIASDPQNEGSKIASASSIYKLHSRVSNIENNGATSITVTGTGNAITSVSKNGTSITFSKGATFLTSHQSLANYYTKGQVDNIANGKSSTSHTHSVIINGVTKTIAATSGTAVNLGTYLTSHQSLADYAKKSEIPTKLSQLTNDKNFVTGSVSGQTITINGVSTTWQNTWRGITDSYSGTSTATSLSQKGANSLYNALHNGYASSAGNADTVDNEHASAFTRIIGKHSIRTSGTAPYNYIHLFRIANSSGYSTLDCEIDIRTRYHSAKIEIRISTAEYPYNNGGTSISIVKKVVSGRTCNLWCLPTVQSSNYNYYDVYYDSGAWNSGTYGITLKGDNGNLVFEHKGTNLTSLPEKAVKVTNKWISCNDIEGVVDNADKLDGIHANGLLTALSNSDKGISITVGGTTKSISNISVNHASNADTASKVYGQVADTGSHELVRCDMSNDQFRIIAGSSGNNNGWAEIATADDGNEPIYVRQYSGVFSSVVRTLTLLDANGHTHFPSYINIGGNENNNSSPDRVWGSNGSDSYLRSYRTSALNVNYAASAGNADTVDSYHASHLLVKRGRLGDYNIDHETTFGTRDIQPSSEITISGKKPFNGWGTLLVIGSIDGASNNQLAFTGPNRMYIRCAYGTRNNHNTNDWATVALTSDNVASATKLQTPRTIWGQSFDGTNNIDGTLTITNSGSDNPHIISTVAKWFHIVSKYKLVLYAGDYNISQRDAINILSNHNVGIGVDPSYKLHVAGDIYSSSTIRTAAQNKAIVLSNDSSPAWISALDGRVIFNTGKDIRFGETAWDWNEWAGLKYTHSNKTIYLGIADGSAFYANNPQSNGTLKFPGITTITPDSGARIGGSGGNLYLGNANDSGWVCTQSICSQTNSSLWSIRQDGNAYFKNIYSGAATINGNLSVNGLISNKGILPTNYKVNDKGPACYVSADALCSGITAITDSIQVNQVTVQYSNDNGNSWTNYSMSNDAKFNLYANNAGLNQVYLGYNVITGNNDAEKLAQVKKNELIVSFYISNNCYAQPYFASVDMSNGIYTICTVEILNNSGVVLETYTKRMTGWNQLNYINLSNGNTSQGVGNDSRRYIRFRFKHDQNTTALRNTIINKIRIFSFTKYSFPTDRFMGHTGHIYNFDYNMNTYFPNSILAKGGVTAYQSSDVRLKTNINKLNCLNVIKSIGGTYEFDYIRDHKHSIGFIAQNVNNPLLKDIVAKDDNGYLKINYWNPKLISLAFGALTEIDDEVDKLKARVRELESEVEYLKNKDYALQ